MKKKLLSFACGTAVGFGLCLLIARLIPFDDLEEDDWLYY